MKVRPELNVKEAHKLALETGEVIVIEKGAMTPTGRFIEAGLDSKVNIIDKYIPLIEGDTRYSLIQGGRASGKSFMTSLFLLLLTYEKGQKILFTRYTMTSAESSIIPEFKGKIELLGLEDDFDVTNKEIVNTKTKASVLFKGMKASSGTQTANLKSLTDITCFVVDEAEEVYDFEDFDKVNKSVRSKNGQNRVMLILNAGVRTHWIYKKYFEELNIPDDHNGVEEYNNCTYIHTTYKDVYEYLDNEYVDEAEKLAQRNPEEYSQVFGGAWRNLHRGVIYTNWTEGKYEVHGREAIGLDFGFSRDQSAAVLCSIKWGGEGERNTVFMKELLYEKELIADDIAVHLQPYRHLPVYGDNARPENINSLVRKGIRRAVSAEKPKLVDSIGLMKSFEFVVEGENLIWELQNYAWDLKNYGTDVPKDKDNHLCDAFRYGVNEMNKRKGYYAVHVSDDSDLQLADKFLKANGQSIYENSGYAIG